MKPIFYSIVCLLLNCTSMGGDDFDTKIRVMNRIVPALSVAQIDFINEHYSFVMTGYLSHEIREKISGPKLMLYRSIQGTWESFNHFDWAHINSMENMFCHNSSFENPHLNQRIQTIWNSWLMDPSDMVTEDNPDAMNHWINYYSITASTQVTEYQYDGLFIDSAGHKLNAASVYGLLPDDYSDEDWKDARYSGLTMIKSKLPGKTVIFNGLHNGNGAEYSLKLTDGGMWEGFGFSRSSGGNYKGLVSWQKAIELFNRNNHHVTLAMVSKSYGLTQDIEKRSFILASYLLVYSPNVTLSMIDLDYDDLTTVYWYPEYKLELGKTLGKYFITPENLYVREFEKGIVLVNPSSTKTLNYLLDKPYQKVIAEGGGALPLTGISDGMLRYERVSDLFQLPPVTGYIFLKE